MKIIYRISDSKNNKDRPHYFSKQKCFLNFVKVFSGYDIYVIADNIVKIHMNSLMGTLINLK